MGMMSAVMCKSGEFSKLSWGNENKSEYQKIEITPTYRKPLGYSTLLVPSWF